MTQPINQKYQDLANIQSTSPGILLTIALPHYA
jgi:hypothetical protein